MYYKNDRTNKKYYCVDCGRIISIGSEVYDDCKCKSCFQKGKLTNKEKSLITLEVVKLICLFILLMPLSIIGCPVAIYLAYKQYTKPKRFLNTGFIAYENIYYKGKLIK